MFDFKHIKVTVLQFIVPIFILLILQLKAFDRSYIDQPGPMVSKWQTNKMIDCHNEIKQVVFATPGMLHAGLSLTIFKKWAEDEKNMV